MAQKPRENPLSNSQMRKLKFLYISNCVEYMKEMALFIVILEAMVVEIVMDTN
jgi:hypothetical protein